MVFRKPYAFFIKYFKLINFVLALLAVYVAYCSYNFITFFREYLNNSYSGSYYVGFYTEYIGVLYYLAIFLILIGLFCICVLFVYKKKPFKFYLVSLIFYIALLIYILIVKNAMIGMVDTAMTSKIARMYWDISILVFIFQLIIIFSIILRCLGIGNKKLNFNEDLKILEKDNEEIEITFKNDKSKEKLTRYFFRFTREFKYYVKENKFVFSLICTILVIVLIFVVYKAWPTGNDNTYSTGKAFTISDLNYTFEDSIITNLNYDGSIISEDYYYLVVRVNIENTTNKNISIDYNSYRLEIGDSYLYPVIDQGIYFIDYVRNYYSNEVKANTSGTYSLVYKINDNDIKKKYKIKVSSGTSLNGGKYNYVTLTPVVINNVTTQSTINIGSTLDFSNSNLGNTSLTLSNYTTTQKYIYDYEYCSTISCNTYKDIVSVDYTKLNTTLIVMDYEFTLDETVPFYSYGKTVGVFLKSFASVKYVIDDTTYTSSVSVVTPNKLEGKIVLETTNAILNADEVYLSFTIRNKEYLVKLN